MSRLRCLSHLCLHTRTACFYCPQDCNPLLCESPDNPICKCPGCEYGTIVNPRDPRLPTCKGRIVELMYQNYQQDTKVSAKEACRGVAERYPLHCGQCHPKNCGSSLYCGCQDCAAVWDTQAGPYTCGQRIRYLTFENPSEAVGMEDACRWVAEDHPFVCGPACHPDKCDGRGPKLCGCYSCTLEVWNRPAGGSTCGEVRGFIGSVFSLYPS